MFILIFAFTHQFANQFNHHLVINVIVVGFDDVSLAQLAFFQDEVNGRVVIINVNPVADLLELAHHPVGAQHLGDGEHDVGGGGPGRDGADELEAPPSTRSS